MVTAPALLDIVESLIGPEITSNPIQHVRIKPPATDLRDDEVRAHITGDRLASGPRRGPCGGGRDPDGDLLARHHRRHGGERLPDRCSPRTADQAMLPHCPKVQTGIADGFIDEARAVPLPVRAGGVVLFHPLTPHASLVNRTDGFRWSFDLRYHVTGEPSGRSWFPDFVARSRTHPETELRDWRRWREMWEDARSRCAANPHIPIHRWTSDSPFCA